MKSMFLMFGCKHIVFSWASVVGVPVHVFKSGASLTCPLDKCLWWHPNSSHGWVHAALALGLGDAGLRPHKASVSAGV